MHDLLLEARQAARLLLRAPAHTIPIVILLALGIGANAAMFSLFNAFFVRDLPVRQPEQLAAITPYWSVPNFEDYRAAQTSFTGVLAVGSSLGTVVRGERGERLNAVNVMLVTENYFDLLGVGAARGRLPQPDDTGSLIVISDAFWSRQFDRLSNILDQILSREVLLGRAGSLFGTLALLISCFGTYAVVSYLVSARRVEIGIRLAVGAAPHAVLRQVVGDALLTVAPGIVLGAAAAWAAGRWVESLLFGVSRQDPVTYGIVAAALSLATALAAWLPARRASRIDPMQALRSE